MREKDLKNELIDNLFQKISIEANSQLDLAYETLSKRGFLLDREADRIVVSDNSSRDDKVFLEKIFKKNGLGCVNQEGEIMLNKNFKFDYLKDFFYIYNNSIIVGNGYWGRWSFFKRRNHGFKTPVRKLEPFIARLVKGVSAAGIISMNSCEGHIGQRDPLIIFDEKYSSMWFKVLLDCFARGFKKLENRWVVRGERCEIRFPTNRNLLEVYLEIIEVGDYFYEHRIKLRKIKRKVMEEVDEKKIKRIAEGEVYNYFKELFLKTQKDFIVK